MIIKYQFKLNISLPRIIFGVLFLALGISMLIGGPAVRNRSNMIFSEGSIQVTKHERDYNVVFGNMVVDLTNVPKDELKGNLQINTVFGNALVKLNPEIPTIVKVNSAFGSGNTPDGSTIVFGDHTYRMGEDDPVLTIEANVVFGKIDIVEE